MSIRRATTAGLVLLAGVLLALARWLAPGTVLAPAAPSAPTQQVEADARTPREARVARDAGALDDAALAGLRDPALADRIREVVDSFDRTGRPPAGVAQGGRRRGARGVFQNAEGHLPRREPRYYTETDVWPRGEGGRGALRLVFGRQGEVYFTSDHYRSFTRLR